MTATLFDCEPARVGTKAKLVWFSTARREPTKMGIKKVWRTKCGSYQVTTFPETSGLRGGDFSAWVRDGEFFRLITRHRTQSAAVKACCSHAKGGA